MRMGRPPVDLTGQRFGRLIATENIGAKNGHALWLCKCDCGNEHIATANNLKGGHVSSCGCLVDEIDNKRKNNMIGKRFGRLVVLEKDKTKNNRSFWKCQCDCGNIIVVTQGNLKSGTVKSCGCLADEYRRNCEIKNRKYNSFETDGNIVYISVESGKFLNKKIICDLDDWERILKSYHWGVNNDGYAYTSKRGEPIFMHKIVANANGDVVTDHINQNTLDNRKKNLRNTNYSMNGFNRKVKKTSESGYNGVWKDKQTGKWKSGICVNGKKIHLGYYALLEDAIEARKKAEIKYRGELSRKD